MSTDHAHATHQDDRTLSAVAWAAMHPLQTFLRHHTWVHTILGLIGNTCFVVGSVFFLFEPVKTAGIWLFVVGSLGMLLGSVGQAVVNWEEPG